MWDCMVPLVAPCDARYELVRWLGKLLLNLSDLSLFLPLRPDLTHNIRMPGAVGRRQN